MNHILGRVKYGEAGILNCSKTACVTSEYSIRHKLCWLHFSFAEWENNQYYKTAGLAIFMYLFGFLPSAAYA